MDAELFIMDFFESIGFTISKIPETDKKTPDFIAERNGVYYVIEVKSKFPSDEQIYERDHTLSSGEIDQTHEPISPHNRLHGIIKNSKEQLANYDAPEGAFKMCWFVCLGYLGEPRRDQFESTLYGSTTILNMDPGGKSRDCYYFHNSDFYRYRHTIDAAVISGLEDGKLCVNNLSPNYERFINSPLVQEMARGVLDPTKLDESGKAYVVDSDVNRSDKAAVTSYLQKKYDMEKIMDMTMKHMTGSMLVEGASD